MGHDDGEDRFQVERGADGAADLAQGLQLFHGTRELQRLRLQRARALRHPLLQRPVGLLQALLVAPALGDEGLKRTPHGVEVAGQVADLILLGRVDGRREVAGGDQPRRALQRGERTRDVPAGDEDGGRGERRDAHDREHQDPGDVPENRRPEARPRHCQAHRADPLALVDNVGGVHEEGGGRREVRERLALELGLAARDRRLALREDLHEGQRILLQQSLGKGAEGDGVEVPQGHRRADLREPGGVLEQIAEAGVDLADVGRDDDRREPHQEDRHDADEGRGEACADAARPRRFRGGAAIVRGGGHSTAIIRAVRRPCDSAPGCRGSRPAGAAPGRSS